LSENIENDPVAYRSHVRIQRVKGPIRRAFVPAHDGLVMIGVHSEVTEHCGVENNVVDPYTTTLDYVVCCYSRVNDRNIRTSIDITKELEVIYG